MTITTIKTPNKIIMSLTPELNKHEFLMTLILVNGCCHKFYENKTDIYLAESFILKNILMTESLKHYIKKTLETLVGQKLICNDERKPEFVLFEHIQKIDERYYIKLNKELVDLINKWNNYTLLDGGLMSQLKTINLLKFYCLMKRWGGYGNYHCYVEWLKWYLNVKNMETKRFFYQYLARMVNTLDGFNFQVKITKCHESVKDKKLINKIVLNIFDTYKELLDEGI